MRKAKTTIVLEKRDNPKQSTGSNQIVHGDNLQVLQALPDSTVHLIYIDPPFNTGRRQQRLRMRTVRDLAGDRTGFGGHRYRTELLSSDPVVAELAPENARSQAAGYQTAGDQAAGDQAAGYQAAGYEDSFDDLAEFLRPRILEARRVLAPTGSLFFHIDPREVHYCKVMLDGVFGRASFQNEIIWAYDYGARARKRWPAKHDNILWYTKDPDRYTFNLDVCDRIPYMAPGLVGAEKAARGKTPTDVWWHTIVSPTGKEKTGYATQKPLGVLERIIRVHSNPGDLVLDFFAGSGTAGEAAAKHGRNFIMVDQSAEAVRIMQSRLARWIEGPSTPADIQKQR